MRQSIFIIYGNDTKYVADRISKQIYVNELIYSDNSEITGDVLLRIASLCKGEFFYIIKTEKEKIFTNFDFSYKPLEWDKDYIHIWDHDTDLRLFNKDNVIADPESYTDTRLYSGDALIKNISTTIAPFPYPVFDIIFLSYDEEYADDNYLKLKSRFPRANRLHNIKGIFEAHRAAAEWAKYNNSDMFYVVDADADILPTFNFNYQPHSIDRNSVHVWHSINPVNDLEYGYGGVKLFPTSVLLDYAGSPIDFTTSASKYFKVIDEVSNVTRFNTDPFSAWRSGFRECAKLASKIIPNQDNSETEYRLNVWCSKGADREFGDFAITGAKEGAEFGALNKDKPDVLGLINNFEWLEKKFSS